MSNDRDACTRLWDEQRVDAAKMGRLAAEVVDEEAPGANMYGCRPCPKCKSEFRCAYERGGQLTIECDDCGHKATAEKKAVKR